MSKVQLLLYGSHLNKVYKAICSTKGVYTEKRNEVPLCDVISHKAILSKDIFRLRDIVRKNYVIISGVNVVHLTTD